MDTVSLPFALTGGISAVGCYLNYLEAETVIFLPVFSIEQEGALDHLIDIAQILLLHISGNKIAEPTGGQRPILQCAIENLAAEAAVLDRLHSGYVQRYEELIRQNQLFFTLDIIKDKLASAYKQTDEAAMAEEISDIMDICTVTKNKHLLWFRRILDEHFEGIIAHATFNITAGRIEGINNKIKTLRRKGYGYPDDDYFFLKLFDVSRNPYIRNPSSHNFYD